MLQILQLSNFNLTKMIANCGEQQMLVWVIDSVQSALLERGVLLHAIAYGQTFNMREGKYIERRKWVGQ